MSGWSLVQRSPTEGSVSECDHESSTMRRPTGGEWGVLLRHGKKKVGEKHVNNTHTEW